MSSPEYDVPTVQLQARRPFERPGPIPGIRLDDMLQIRDLSSLVPREPSSTGVSLLPTTSCGPNDTTGPCERPVDGTNSTTLPIVLGVVIPLTFALVILIVLHRRHVKKLRQEDANDRHKSLDFGMGERAAAQRKADKNNRDVPQMSKAETVETVKRGRGLSMDLLENPYLLPPGLQQSRESLHSLSRSLHTEDDKYRPATTFVGGDGGSMSYPSSLRSPADDSSSFTGSSRRRFETDSNRNLIRHAQRMSRSGPPTRPTSVKSFATTKGEQQPFPPGLRKDSNHSTGNNMLAPAHNDAPRDSYVSTASTGMNAAIRASNDYLGAFIRGGGLAKGTDVEKSPMQTTVPASERAPLSSSPDPQPPAAAMLRDEQPKRKSVVESVLPTPSKSPGQESEAFYTPLEEVPGGKSQNKLEREPRLPQLSFMGSTDFQQDFRLPDTDNKNAPQETSRPSQQPLAEATSQQRPDRSATLPGNAASTAPKHGQYSEDTENQDDIYDVYEYRESLGYDPRRLTFGQRPLPPDDPTENPEQRANRIRSFYKEYFDDSKPSDGQHQSSNYYDGSEEYADYGADDYYDEPDYYQMPHPPRGPAGYAGSERHRATHSTGSFMSSPRAMSTASGQWGMQGRRPPPKKKMPPPKPLHNLPTPHMLKDDTFIPIDFAPPQTYKDRRAGTPDSLRGGVRPYSPALRAHNPLLSSFDDLSAMPSPHALRKSGTFTSLDFAPPRFKVTDSGSDSGSIRSNRSAMSAQQLHSMRAGAYRVSRIPKNVAGTKNEMADALRPQWDMRQL